MIPIILGALAIGSGVFGAVKSLEGLSDLDEADRLKSEAESCYANAMKIKESLDREINSLVADYQEFISAVETEMIVECSDYLRSNTEIESYIRELHIVERITPLSIEEIKAYRQQGKSPDDYFNVESLCDVYEVGTKFKDFHQIIQGGTTSSLSLLANGIGISSTGAAISTLSGAAANSATLAWLGGGSLASGGGGMALGTIVSQGMFIGSSFIFVGSAVAKHGANKLLQVQEYADRVNSFIDELNSKLSQFDTWEELVIERQNSIAEIMNLLSDNIEELDHRLEFRPFDRKKDSQLIQSILKMLKTLVDLIQAPID